MFKNATSVLKASRYEIVSLEENVSVLCYQKEDIGLNKKEEKPVIKRIEDSDDSLNFGLVVREKMSVPHCQNPKCYSVADLNYSGKIYLCYKCLDSLREHRSNYELARFFNSKEKILKLLTVIDEWNHPQRKKEVIRCTNIYCATTENMTSHHLIPKQYRKGIVGKIGRVPLCEDCHKKVHKMKSNADLAMYYNTKETIRELLASDREFRVQRLLYSYVGTKVAQRAVA